jgi:deoxyribonuclease-4
MNIKFGLKLWSTNANVLKEVRELLKERFFQYIELMPTPGTTITPFKKLDASYVIHVTTEDFGLNIADIKKKKSNLKIIQNNIEWANELNATDIILHPGYGSLDVAVNFLNSIDDERILIENMPKIGIHNEKMIGYDSIQIEQLINNKFGFCLDLNHGIKASISLKKPYEKHIEELLSLAPKVFHISDGALNNEKDDHLHIGNGDYNFSFLLECIKKNKYRNVTLETPRDSFKDDLRNLSLLQSFLKTL